MPARSPHSEQQLSIDRVVAAAMEGAMVGVLRSLGPGASVPANGGESQPESEPPARRALRLVGLGGELPAYTLEKAMELYAETLPGGMFDGAEEEDGGAPGTFSGATLRDYVLNDEDPDAPAVKTTVLANITTSLKKKGLLVACEPHSGRRAARLTLARHLVVGMVREGTLSDEALMYADDRGVQAAS